MKKKKARAKPLLSSKAEVHSKQTIRRVFLRKEGKGKVNNEFTIPIAKSTSPGGV
jgi:hypothetical protein